MCSQFIFNKPSKLHDMNKHYDGLHRNAMSLFCFVHAYIFVNLTFFYYNIYQVNLIAGHSNFKQFPNEKKMITFDYSTKGKSVHVDK